MKINRLNESNDEFFDIQDLIADAIKSIGGDMDDITGDIVSNGDEDNLMLSFYSTTDRKDARRFSKNFRDVIEQALSKTRFKEVSDETHTYAYRLSRNDIHNQLGPRRGDEFHDKFAQFEILITAYGKRLEEGMTIAYSEETIKRMISQLEKEIEDYKQLIIDEPEDKNYWEEEIKKCEEEIADLQSYKPLNEDDKQEILYVIRDSKGNQLSAPNPDDNELWDRVASMEARGRRGLCVVVYTGKKVNESTRSLGEEDFIEVDDPSVVDKLDYAGAVEIRGNKVYADANTLKQLKNDMDNLTEAKIFGAKGKKELKEAGELIPIEVLNQDGTPKQYDVKFMDLERLPGKLNWDVADQLQDHFRKNNLWVDELHYNQVNDRIEFDINWGDWKHEHLRAKWLLQELFDTLGIKAEIRSHTTEEDGTDTYSAHYVVYSIG